MSTVQRARPRLARVVLAAATLLLVPLVAMQLTPEVSWGPGDFALAAALLVGTGLAYELIASGTRNLAFRAGAAIAVGAALLLIWVNLAVGFLGDEGNRANLMYAGVLAIEAMGAAIARFRPAGMARAMFVTAFAQALVASIALAFGLGGGSGAAEIVLTNAAWVLMFSGAGALFLRAAKDAERA